MRAARQRRLGVVLSVLSLAAALGASRPAFAQQPGVFDLLSPADGATSVSLTPTLDWEDSLGVLTYTLLVDDDLAFGSPAVSDDTTLTESECPRPLRVCAVSAPRTPFAVGQRPSV